MNLNVEDCERCGATIASAAHTRDRRFELYREVSPSEFETDSVLLCSMCLDDVWKFVLEGSPDRSDKADPIPLDKMAESVDRHITDLKNVLQELEEAKQ